MELTIGGPPWIYVISAIALYLLALASYRLLLHPLAAFPGPKLAAVTRYVEAYYDVVCNGQYTFKIKEMHRKYGKEKSYLETVSPSKHNRPHCSHQSL